MVLSEPAEAGVLPSGLNASAWVRRLCPARTEDFLRLATSHKNNFSAPTAKVFPSGLNATAQTQVGWPVRVPVRLPLATSQSSTPPPHPAAKVLPSGL